jgi:hypothetical protein
VKDANYANAVMIRSGPEGAVDVGGQRMMEVTSQCLAKKVSPDLPGKELEHWLSSSSLPLFGFPFSS